MKLARRGFFATLFAPLAAKFFPGLGQIKTCVFKPRSLGLTTESAGRLAPFSMAQLNEAYNSACFGREHPTVIWCGSDVWKAFKASYPEGHKYYNPNGAIHQMGLQTLAFNGAEVACTGNLQPNEVLLTGGPEMKLVEFADRAAI